MGWRSAPRWPVWARRGRSSRAAGGQEGGAHGGNARGERRRVALPGAVCGRRDRWGRPPVRLAYAVRCGPFRRVDFARPHPAPAGRSATSVPAGNCRVCGAAGCQGGAPPGARVTTEKRGRWPRADQRGCNGSRQHKAAARRRRALRAPAPPLEPEDEAIHLHRAQRHLHHRPAADARVHRQRLRVRQADGRPRWLDPVRRYQASGAGSRRGAGHPRRHALRQPALAGRHAHQLLDRAQAPAAPQGARGPRADRCPGQPLQEGAAGPQPREGQARAQPRWYPGHAEGAQRHLDRGHQEGAHRRRRGPQAQHPGGRDRVHQPRPQRGRLQDPGQRRRDPQHRRPHPGGGRRRRRRPDGPLGRAGQRRPRGRRGAGHRRRRAAGRLGAGALDRWGRHGAGRGHPAARDPGGAARGHRERGRPGRGRARHRRHRHGHPGRPERLTAAGAVPAHRGDGAVARPDSSVRTPQTRTTPTPDPERRDMADFTAADVKRLRDATGAGMMDCKKALTEADGDYDKAVELLRIKGAKDVGKRLERSTTNGVVVSKDGALLELDCETDFVAKNADFVALAERLLDVVLAQKPGDVDALLATEIDGQTVAALIESESARIGEKLVLSRFAVFEGTTATYLHKRATDLPPAIGVAVQYSGGSEDAARSLAMHIAAARPRYLTREEVPAEAIETERRVAEQTAKEEGKPEQAITKIVEGRVNAYFKDFVLLEQPSITEPKRSVKQILDEAGLTVDRFARFEVGQA